MGLLTTGMTIENIRGVTNMIYKNPIPASEP